MLLDSTQGRRSGENRDAPFIGGGEAGLFVLVLPRQLTHHFQQSLVLLFELLVLIFNVIQVLRKGQNRQLRGKHSVDTLRHMNIHNPASKPLRVPVRLEWESLTVKASIT